MTDFADLPFDPRESRLVLSLSGGKDSAAMALHFKEMGLPFTAVFADTGWEHPMTYAYIRDELEPRFGPIQWLRSKSGVMLDWMDSKMMFPSRVIRWCTEELKVIPIRDHLAGLITEPGGPVINVVGIRALESSSRAAMPRAERWKADGRGKLDAWIWRPMHGWTEEDVIAIHQRHGLRPNPLYLLGATRVGCWPCIHARKHEIALVARHTPERIDLIREREAKLTTWARDKARRRAETPWPANLLPVEQARAAVVEAEAIVRRLEADMMGARLRGDAVGEATAAAQIVPAQEALGRAEEALDDATVETDMRDPAHWRQTRTFFAIGEKGRGMPSDIDNIVRWASTARGGKQWALFEQDELDNAARDGCMRWGMCETETAEPLASIRRELENDR